MQGRCGASHAELLEEVGRLEQGLKLVGAELEHFAAAPAEGASEDAAAAAERFSLVMRPFYDGATPQVGELQRAAEAMGEAQNTLRAFYSEDAKAPIDETYSRWASCLGQVESAVINLQEDKRKADKSGK